MKITLLKEFFAGFLQNRHIARHFRRLAMLDSLTDTTVSREMPPTLAQTLIRGASSDAQSLLDQLHSHSEGLTDAEASALRQQHGLNEVEHEQPLPWWVHLWHCYKNPFNLLLTLLALISWLTEDMKAATVIFSMVVLSTLLRFWQEARSNQAADALKAMVSNTATVLRRADDDADFAPANGKSRHIELPIRQLVPGDVIVLSAGDMIPADCRVLSAKDLFVSQAAANPCPWKSFLAAMALSRTPRWTWKTSCSWAPTWCQARPRE
jgi:Mg2+-importing ATPase